MVVTDPGLLRARVLARALPHPDLVIAGIDTNRVVEAV